MNIFISADDKFIMPTKVMLTSFFLNNKNENHTIYFLYSAVSSNNLNVLQLLVDAFNGVFVPVLIDENDFTGFSCKHGYPLLVYYRLLVGQILPATEDRALWMDVDLVVNGDLSEFYYQDFDGCILAACRDCDVPTRMSQLGCPPGSVYINAGVVLYNTAVLRQYSLADFFDYYKTHEEYIMFQDQDILNGMFATKIKVWENNLYNYFAPSGFVDRTFDFKSWSQQVKIVHYICKSKPWSNSYTHPMGALWDRYYLATFPKSALGSSLHLLYRKCIRLLNRLFIFPLRVLHGKLDKKTAGNK